MSLGILLAFALVTNADNYNAIAYRSGFTDRVSGAGSLLNCPAGTVAQISENDFKDKLMSWNASLLAPSKSFRPPSLWNRPLRLEYPKKLFGEFRRGKVVVTVFINEMGTVSEAMVTCTSDHFFNDAALEHARRIVFYPATLDGNTVRSVAHQPLDFSGP